MITVNDLLTLAKHPNNMPATPLHLQRLQWLCPVVDSAIALLTRLGYQPRLTSGYRSPSVNRMVGGSNTSDHLSALAVDLGLGRATAIDNLDPARLVFEHRAELLCRPQQIIAEPGHVHIGWPDEAERAAMTYRSELRLKDPSGHFPLQALGS